MKKLALSLACVAGSLGCTFKSEIVSSGGLQDGDVVTPPPYILTIGPNGTSPQVLHVWRDYRATIVNADSRPHNIVADGHPTHYQCGGVLNVGVLQPGERREVTKLPADACFFHDETNPEANAFWGVLVVH